MSGDRILVAATVTVAWVLGGVVLSEIGVAVSELELAASGLFDLSSLGGIWVLGMAIIGTADVLVIWDELEGM